MELGHALDIRNTAYFRHLYDSEHVEMRRLYEQAKRDQWNVATDIDQLAAWASPWGTIDERLGMIHADERKVTQVLCVGSLGRVARSTVAASRGEAPACWPIPPNGST